MSIWSKRITESAAFWGMLCGFVFNITPKFFDYIGMIQLPTYLNPVLIGASVSLIVTIVMSRRTTVSEVESTYLTKLHETPAVEIDRKKTRTTLLAPVLLIANGLIMPFLLIRYYVRPYQSATGTLTAEGSLDWFAGEVVLAMSWFVVYVSLGLFAIRMIRREYSATG
jgi:sodium/pantothenate symporter